MQKEAILVINTGSSSIKFSLFSCEENLHLLHRGEIKSILDAPQFSIFNHKNDLILAKKLNTSGYASTFKALFEWLNASSEHFSLQAVGHRVVHGGKIFFAPTLINHDVLDAITKLIPLAPLHQPYNIEGIKIVTDLYPNLKQIACFDTAFHTTQDRLAKLFAIPRELTDEGIIRYGFHGLSYEYIASVLPDYLREKAKGRVIVAHLGNGTSACALFDQRSVATTMGFTALDGLMMGTRCGNIDPGILLFLLQGKRMTLEELTKMLYHQSGLLGVSSISSDMRELESYSDKKSIEAVDLFCYRAAREISSLCSAIQGCDAIVFTAGIGENSALVRKKICTQLEWLGITLDDKANQNKEIIISSHDSKVIACAIPTNEEYMLAKHTYAFITI